MKDKKQTTKAPVEMTQKIIFGYMLKKEDGRVNKSLIVLKV